MNLFINGQSVELSDSIKTVGSLLNYYGLGDKVVIVELNATILEKDTHQETAISDGDKLELVHFVGGG
ncbi:sulfur carrier protein ThiS [Aquibacillus kalidii]|uniref:sulfur carrier protein ThiS n=1 Tax=Aquibacillus kalidii TaxID=2762597 RepID=UPI001646AD5F|nr:sulfur carrier protein ThiS [Aquibacillus kalidii]